MYSMIEPDVVLPEQLGLLGSRGVYQPERRLMLAVLEDAIQTVMRHGGDPRPKPRKLVREVERWIDPRNNEGIFAFGHVCAILDLDAASIRRGIHQLLVRLEQGRASRSRLGFARRMAGERHRVSLARSYRQAAAG